MREASHLPSLLAAQVGLQTTSTTMSGIALGFGLQEAARLGRKVSPNLPSEISRHIAVDFAPQTCPETGVKLDSDKPFGVALDTTPGTVMGTVPTAILKASI